MPSYPFIPTEGFTSGRDGEDILGIAVHGYSGSIEQLDSDVSRCNDINGAAKHGITFHYGIGGQIAHQYILDEDQSWSWAEGEENPLSAADPSLPDDPDTYTLNIALSYSANANLQACDRVSDGAIATLVTLICAKLRELGLDVSETTVFPANNELAFLDWEEIQEQVTECLDTPVEPPVDYFCEEILECLTTLPEGGEASDTTLLVGTDGNAYTLPAAASPTDSWRPDYVEFWGPGDVEFADGDNGELPIGTPPANAWGVKLMFNVAASGGSGFGTLTVTKDSLAVANIGIDSTTTYGYATIDVPVDPLASNGNISVFYSTMSGSTLTIVSLSIVRIGWLVQ